MSIYPLVDTSRCVHKGHRPYSHLFCPSDQGPFIGLPLKLLVANETVAKCSALPPLVAPRPAIALVDRSLMKSASSSVDQTVNLCTMVGRIRIPREFWLVRCITVDEVNGDERRHHEGS